MAKAHVDVDGCPASDFCLEDKLEAGTQSAWHAHSRHQLLYASLGTLKLQTQDTQWYLPPHRAAFIPASTPHRVSCSAESELCTVYLATERCPQLPLGVFSVLPVAREMLLYARRWGASREPRDPLAESYFETLGRLASEWVGRDVALCLPVPSSTELKRAFDYILANLSETHLAAAASAARVSERTLSRRFKDETGTTLRQFVRTARVLRAMERLSTPGTSVTEVAFDVGFEDVTALSRAFKAVLGELPSEYQKRAAA